MPDQPRSVPEFSVTHETTPRETVLAGFSMPGLAGLTAVDFLVDQLNLQERGHITVEGLSSITPFEAGVPHHPTRLFSRDDLDVTVLVGELFVPAWVGDPFSEAILDWTENSDVEEIAILSGIPIGHGPDDHRTYYIATPEYRDQHLVDADVPPMGRGFLDGINAALIQRGLDAPLDVGVYVTPVHAQTPDVEAAIRLVETAIDVYDLDVDASPLQAFAAEIQQYYGELADRMSARDEERPEDRMFM